MPRMFVVRDQRNLAELGSVLLKGRISAGAKESALDAIRRANPSLNLDKIPPGTVVMVPPVDGLKDTSSHDPARVAADDLVSRVRGALETLTSAGAAAEDQRQGERKETQGLLSSAQIKRLSSQVPELASNIESLRSSFKEDDVAAREQQAALGAAQEQWAADLEVLRGRL